MPLRAKSRINLEDQRPKPDHEAPRTRVLLISDGRPGHYRQSEGIVAALRRRGPIDLDRVELRTRVPRLPKALVPKLGRLLPPSWFLKLIHNLDTARLVRPDVIVSSGGPTLGANVALARICNAPNVFSGSTRGYPLAAFRLVLTPYASVATAPPVVAGPKPTPFDPGRIPSPSPLGVRGDVSGARVCVLIGGPTPYADFGPADWSRLAALVEALVSDLGCRVTIVTSPRTPDEAYARLLPLADGNGGAVSVIDFRVAGPGSIEAAFDCDLILVTSDSMSMMTEAAVSQRPAVALAPAVVQPNKDDEAIAVLIARGWLAVLPLAKTDADSLVAAAMALRPMQENHLDRLGNLLHTAMGPARVSGDPERF